MRQIILVLLLSAVSLSANNDCLACHKEKQKQCKNSRHFTLTSAINITRKAWGIIDSNVTLQSIPLPKTEITKPADLVDDFLRRKCLKCHLGLKGSGEKGMQRGRSCLACHRSHNPNGKCQPRPIATEKCLACHNKSFVGTDYAGLFPKDHHHAYRAPLTKEGKFPEQKYGIDHHHLVQDIHYRKGMSCVDCHTSKNGKNWERRAQCIDCHTQPSPANHPDYHGNIACSACHSAWQTYSYELSVFRDDMADYAKWKNLTLQEDGYLTRFLDKALKSKRPIPPRMPDWVDRKMRKGIWYSGWRYRRWEDFVLGNGSDGRIHILRPLFQYRISYRDTNGAMVLDDVRTLDNGQPIEAWAPYAPHTIIAKAKSCEMCHENRLLYENNVNSGTVLNLKIPRRIIDGSPLTAKQKSRLHSKHYRHKRAKMWKTQGSAERN